MDGIAEGSEELDFDDEESWDSGSSVTSFGENEDDVGFIHYPGIKCLERKKIPPFSSRGGTGCRISIISSDQLTHFLTQTSLKVASQTTF
jgi:hypothetical protein